MRYTKRKDGRYATNVTIGYNEEGKRIQKKVYGSTERELRQKVLQLHRDIEEGRLIKKSTTTVKDYAEAWVKTYKGALSINTKAMYDNAIDHYINKSIGWLQLQEVRRSDLQKLINDNAEHPRTCEIIEMTLSQIFKSAVADGLLRASPCTGLTLPQKVSKTTRRALTGREKTAIKKAVLTPMQRAFVDILFGTGLRRSEALALTRTDFDWKKKQVTVCKVINYQNNKAVLKDTAKSAAGMRSVPIPDALCASIKAYCDTLDGFILFHEEGQYMSKSQGYDMWDEILEALNAVDRKPQDNAKIKAVPGVEPIDITAHYFRHNYATTLYYSGISEKKAIELMGHSSRKMIMEIYAHLDEEKEDTAKKLNAAFG